MVDLHIYLKFVNNLIIIIDFITIINGIKNLVANFKNYSYFLKKLKNVNFV